MLSYSKQGERLRGALLCSTLKFSHWGNIWGPKFSCIVFGKLSHAEIFPIDFHFNDPYIVSFWKSNEWREQFY